MKEGPDQKEDKLEVIATKSFPPYSDMYRVVDFLNKSLKEKKVMFGLTKDRKSGMMTITIYEV
ncbi:MAG: YpmA family protein [Bacillota bacterium]